MCSDCPAFAFLVLLDNTFVLHNGQKGPGNVPFVSNVPRVDPQNSPYFGIRHSRVNRRRQQFVNSRLKIGQSLLCGLIGCMASSCGLAFRECQRAVKFSMTAFIMSGETALPISLILFRRLVSGHL